MMEHPGRRLMLSTELEQMAQAFHDQGHPPHPLVAAALRRFAQRAAALELAEIQLQMIVARVAAEPGSNVALMHPTRPAPETVGVA